MKKKTRLPISGLKVKRSRPGLGLGLFTECFIPKDTCIVEYTGKKIPTKLADELDTKYLFEINTKWTIDGSGRSNLARYVNHACKPNCESDIVRGHIYYFAVRDIEPGEELTVDYGKEYFDDFIKPVGCKCDSCSKKAAKKKAKKPTKKEKVAK